MKNELSKTVDEYIAKQPPETQLLLNQIRKAIQETAPHAEECISYRMPAYKQNAYLCFFAAYKNHIGFYPLPAAIEKFKEDLTNYDTSKGAVQFPLKKNLPLALIKKMVQFRLKEVQKKQNEAESKKSKKKNAKKINKKQIKKSKMKEVKKKSKK